MPYLAHASMEPLNVAVDLQADRCTIWTGTSRRPWIGPWRPKPPGSSPEQVEIHTTFLGGGFGRRANPTSDFVIEAVQVAKVIGKPIKVVWTREDDMRGGYYRPMWMDQIEAAIGSDGKPLVWKHTIVGQSIVAGTPFENFLTKDGIDATSVEGASTMPYAIPNLEVGLHSPKNVGAGAVVALGRPLAHRLRGGNHDGRTGASGRQGSGAIPPGAAGQIAAPCRVLKLAAEKAGWGKKALPAGHAWGVAVHKSFDSYVAEVAEVSLENGKIRVHRVVAAVDCGMVVNPDGVRQQIESAHRAMASPPRCTARSRWKTGA